MVQGTAEGRVEAAYEASILTQKLRPPVSGLMKIEKRALKQPRLGAAYDPGLLLEGSDAVSMPVNISGADDALARQSVPVRKHEVVRTTIQVG